MQRTKVLAVIFLLGTLVVGGAIGFTADRLMLREVCQKRQDREARSYLADQLNLTPAQRQAVDSILEAKNNEMGALITPLRPQLDSLRDNARIEIFKLLDARQRPQFQRIVEEQRLEEQKREQASKKK
jgi:Spy/CpxP family protein refolding chaperone